MTVIVIINLKNLVTYLLLSLCFPFVKSKNMDLLYSTSRVPGKSDTSEIRATRVLHEQHECETSEKFRLLLLLLLSLFLILLLLVKNTLKVIRLFTPF